MVSRWGCKVHKERLLKEIINYTLIFKQQQQRLHKRASPRGKMSKTIALSSKERGCPCVGRLEGKAWLQGWSSWVCGQLGIRWLCDLEQVVVPLCASDFSSVKIRGLDSIIWTAPPSLTGCDLWSIRSWALKAESDFNREVGAHE